MSQFIQTVTKVNDVLNNFAWGPVMLVLLVGTGIYFTVRTGFFQVRCAKTVYENTIKSLFHKQEKKGSGGGITPFQALTTALAATVGTGNIVGVATAITAGGPGAIFWMWVSAFFGMMTKYAEILLAVHYRSKNEKGEWVGGPMYYIERGLHQKWLATAFALLGLFACFGTGNMTQVNSIAESMNGTFGIPHLVTGIAVAAVTAVVIIGGIKRIGSTTEKLVPLMAFIYVVASIFVLAINFTQIPAAFGLIFKSAFTPTAAVGGFAGAMVKTAIQKGVARGVFSNEAGLGSAPMAHAAADTDHPCRQAMWGVFEVFVASMIVCSCTAIVIISTGAWNSGLDGAALTIAAFSHGLPRSAGVIITISIFFFAFSTLVSWSYYGEKCLEYVVGSSKLTPIYKVLYIAFLVVGATTDLKLVWKISDTLNGFMAVPNLIGLLGLSGTVITMTKGYLKERGASRAAQPSKARMTGAAQSKA